MSGRLAKILILCEDSQHEAFIRRFLAGMGWERRNLRVEKSPSARGSANRWVIKQFPKELAGLRKTHAAAALIVMIDADSKTVQERIGEFQDECQQCRIDFRTSTEAVVIAVPRRSIETWIEYLNGATVDETTKYPGLDRERNCKSAVQNLVRQCKSQGLLPNAPAALRNACVEYNSRIKLR